MSISVISATVLPNGNEIDIVFSEPFSVTPLFRPSISVWKNGILWCTVGVSCSYLASGATLKLVGFPGAIFASDVVTLSGSISDWEIEAGGVLFDAAAAITNESMRDTGVDALAFTGLSVVSAFIAPKDVVSVFDLLALRTPTGLLYQASATGGASYIASPPAPSASGWLPANLLIDHLPGDTVSGYEAPGTSPLLWVMACFPSPSTVAGIEIAGAFGSTGVTANAYGSNDGQTWSVIGWVSGASSYRDLSLTGNLPETYLPAGDGGPLPPATGGAPEWFPVSSSAYRYVAVCFRSASPGSFSVTDLRFNGASAGTGADLTPGLVRFTDASHLADLGRIGLLKSINGNVILVDAGGARTIPSGRVRISHMDQNVGMDPGYQVSRFALAQSQRDVVSLTDAAGVEKWVFGIDALSLSDHAGLRASLLYRSDVATLSDMASVLPGVRERMTLADMAGTTSSPSAWDSLAIVDLSRAGILQAFADAFTVADTASLALALAAPIDAIETEDSTQVSGPRTDSAAEAPSMADAAAASVTIAAADTVSVADVINVLRLLPIAGDTLGFVDAGRVARFEVVLAEALQMAETTLDPSGSGTFYELLADVGRLGDAGCVGVAASHADGVRFSDATRAPAVPIGPDDLAIADAVSVRVTSEQYSTVWS